MRKARFSVGYRKAVNGKQGIGNRRKHSSRDSFYLPFPIPHSQSSVVPRILLVKTSSLGDVVHNLPVASDIQAALPGAEIDWVVEELFAAIPRLHSAVARVLPIAIRRWRFSFLSGRTRGEISAFLKGLRQTAYDVVIDTQGLMKSALIAYAARGVRYGPDFASACEPLSFLYDRACSVPWTLHAVQRNRALAAQALGYVLHDGAKYGIAEQVASFAWLPAGRYTVLVHATSARRKLWAEESWIELGRRLTLDGVRCVLPWGNAKERTRSEHLASAIPQAIVPPALELGEVAGLMAGAAAVAGVDTGLTHLSGALGVPTAGIYCTTDPSATGLYGCARGVNLGGASGPPAVNEVVATLDRLMR